jgi:alpha-tubulin suppressor-like RCC1 family protein
MGLQAFPTEEYEDDESLNLMQKEDAYEKTDDISSMPFQIEFKIPIVKTICGDSFAAILSCEGKVFSWGYNNCGVLGIDNKNIVL